MKVSLWAEIRRLYEIEKLSQRAIVKRLRCGDKTVRKALQTASPPLLTIAPPSPPGGILKPYHPQIDALIAKYPDLSAVRVLEEISRGPEGFRGSVYPVRRYLHKIRPDRGRVYQEVIYEPGEAMQVDWGDCGHADLWPDHAPGVGLRGRVVFQPLVLHRVHPLATQGGVLSGDWSMP